METIVDQLKTVNSKSFLEEVKNPENVKILTLENYNNSTKWNDLEKFINLEQLQLKNCLIENNTFLVRSTNRGVSAIIDNKGNIIKKLNRNEAGNIEFEVPLIKSNKIKNDLIFFVLLITYFSIFFIYRKKNAK